jgi:histone H3/H4
LWNGGVPFGDPHFPHFIEHQHKLNHRTNWAFGITDRNRFERAISYHISYMALADSFVCPVDDDMLFARGTFDRMVRERGKSTKDLREAIRKSTTIFVHYVIDYAAQQHQGDDDQRAVTIKPSDIVKSVDALGFTNIARKLGTIGK